jgi:hypothetical protein
MRLLVLVLALLCGCSTYELGDRYAPITELVDRPNIDFGGRLTTINNKVYVRDLEGWLEEVKDQPDRFHAVMLHEQVHARSQAAYPSGWKMWIHKYTTNTDFMRQEELKAYYAEIQYYRSRGYGIDREGIIETLSGSVYRTIYGNHMMTKEEAAQWIDAVLEGKWTP